MRKDLARSLFRARAAKRDRPTPAPHPNDVTQPLDTWSISDVAEARGTPLPKEEVRPWGRSVEVPEILDAPQITQKTPATKLGKKRTVPLCISVSEEEVALIKGYVSGEGTTVAAFARRAMFAMMGKKIPPRR